MNDLISRQAVIDALEQSINILDAVDRVMDMPQAQDGDLISRQAVLEKQYRIDDSATLSTRDVVNVEDIEDMPSVSQTGHWIAQDIHNCHTDFKCSKCGYIHNFTHLYGEPTADYTYCPNCGAKMVEPQESEDKE